MQKDSDEIEADDFLEKPIESPVQDQSQAKKKASTNWGIMSSIITIVFSAPVVLLRLMSLVNLNDIFR